MTNNDVQAARSGSCAPPLACAGGVPSAPPPFGRVLFSWSGGKDSAMALHHLLADSRYQVVGLLTTISRQFRRVSHHGVREELLDRQAAAIGLPLRKLWFGSADGDASTTTMHDFERALGQVLHECREQGTFLVGHGDIFLQSLRDYREQRLAQVGMRAVFPLWQQDTTELLRHFTASGFGAVITCVEPIAASLAGADLSSALLDDGWPTGVDPCGEHGEYHSFVHRGPIFHHPVAFTRGETVCREGRFYTDLLPN